MSKIAIIGAGSVTFTRRLLQDIVTTDVLKETEVALMDINSERLGVVEAWVKRLVSDAGSSNVIGATTNRRKALEGADYVITTIRKGDDLQIDYGIPMKYGVDQSVADTIGPGGVFKALRTVPDLLDICTDIEEICPDAILLQYTNPMAIACWSIADVTSVRAVGLCHSVQYTTEVLADYAGVSKGNVSAWVAGINHMSWFLRFESDGQDLYPKLWKAMEDPEIYARDEVRFDVMRHFGSFVTESTQHMSEYVPYYRKRPELKKKFNLDTVTTSSGTSVYRSSLSLLNEKHDIHFERFREEIASDIPIKVEKSVEYASRIISAVETGIPTVINGNVPNDGLITNLGEGSCVEVPCVVDKLGIHPMVIGQLPSQLAALCRSNIAVQELAVQAVIDGSKEAARYAVMMDPLTAAVLSLREISDMFDEMWDAHGDALAAYS